ncbi:ferritin-like domain-containing protein [Nannocystis radixulma]|uniref:Ferritin-like domain-containing protein n=1 Tax=Nannocystis radixulma TaxID=2995305 RepID=A0ABT5BP17_9BACT|nr:ferritin-like domain-containing protein [Nannocystis radixulma]MDC0675917.1 ferritin-like domain-containing protein [Nannocystis radixulma]
MKSPDRPTDLDINRTGIFLSPLDGPATVEAARQSRPTSPGTEQELAELRRQFAEEAHPIGHMPPPLAVRAVLQEFKGLIHGHRYGVLLDKLGERLAFERTGVRLFDALIVKLEAQDTWDGGPTLETLVEFRGDEANHFALIHEVLVHLGADPTVVTPSADLVGVESLGLLQTIVDPRTTLAQSLHAQMIAELVDAAGWDQLCMLAGVVDQQPLAAKFRAAHAQEVHHRDTVIAWLNRHAELAALGELKYSA